MSHATVMVAFTPKELADHKNDAQMVVDHNMFPFDENEECFRDGSRWDWYVIGGRWNGFWDNAAGTNIIQVKNINLDKMLEDRRAERRKAWTEAHERSHYDKKIRKFFYNIDPNDTLESYIAKVTTGFPATYAFLQERHWHEPERMGWFGCTTATECERIAERNGITDIDEMIRRCKYKDPETGACVVVWNEPSELWNEHFYDRFIKRLDPETYLAVVDYHV